MASVKKLSFLLSILISTSFAQFDIYLLEGKDGYCSAPVPEQFFIFKNTTEGYMFLWDTSGSLQLNSTLFQSMKNRLSVYTGSYSTFFRVSNLTESDSGRYQVLSRSGNWWFQLVVCSVKFPQVVYMASAELSAELHCEGAGAADSLTVQWFRWKPEWPWGWSRVFSEETGSLNPLMSDLEGRVHMVENSSSLHISNINYDDRRTSFTCVVLDGKSCIGTQEVYVQKKQKYLFHTVGEQAVLPCFESDTGGESQKWFVNLRVFPDEVIHNTDESQQMYMVDGSETGNYTLVIPSLSLNHSGDYECRANYGDNFYLFVSPEPEAQTELFSVGGRVNLSCNFDLIEEHRVVWFVRTARHHGVVLDSMNEYRKLPDDLERRAHLYSSYSTLILSNLSLQDQGEYWCSVYPRDFPFQNMCESTNKIVLIYQEPADLSSPVFAVRASLVSCGLLGLVCAVVAVILKTRTREEDSHRTQTSY